MTITVHVVPRSRKTEVAGRHGDAVKIRLAAPPLDGAANTELCRFLADKLGLPRSAVTVVGGATRRRKTVKVEGATQGDVERLLTADS